MRQMELPTSLRRILPGIVALCVTACGGLRAQDTSTNELNSPIDEPTVIIEEQHSGISVRPASRAVQESTDQLVKLVYETREAQRRRLLSTSDHTPWQIMHGLVGLREDLLLKHNGQIVNGLEWISTGPMYQNEPWFSKTVHGGQAHPFNKPWWFEGHINQFAAILSMASVPLDHQFGTPDGPITMREMIRNAQMTVNAKEEVTWTLWLLSRYLPPDAEWTNAKGERWSIEKLVKVEIGKPVGGPTSPCGGTHGLFALAHARNVYLRTGQPLRGVWLEADNKIQKYIRTARLQLNPDGTLTSSFFKGREYKQDFDKRMASCGHLLEFLMMAVSQDQLNEPWVRKAIEGTAKDLMANRKAYVSCSPLYHATNGLSIYLDRVAPATPEERMANRPEKTKTISQSRVLPKDASSSASAPQNSAAEVGPAATSPGDKPTSSVPDVPTPPAANPAASTTPASTTPAAATNSVKDGTLPTAPDVTQNPEPPAADTPTAEPPGEPSTQSPPSVEPAVPPAAPEPAPQPVADQPVQVVPAAVSMLSLTEPATAAPAPSERSDTTVEILPQLKPVPLVDPAVKTAAPTPETATPVSTAPDATQQIDPSTSLDQALTPATSTSPTATEPSAPTAPDGEPTPEKKQNSWKATPPERRRPMVVSDKSRRA